MGLSCECDYDADDGWTYFAPHDYSVLPGRGKRCCSCKTKITKGDTCLQFGRIRGAKNDIEYRIYGEGDTVELAPWWMCERCGDLYFSLDELGYCVQLGDSMLELVKEYAEEHRVGK